MAQVARLGDARRKRQEMSGACHMPERFTMDQLERLFRLAKQDHFALEEVHYAYQTVKGWSETRRQKRTDWVMVCIVSMRQGWGLRGFGHWKKRGGHLKCYKRVCPEKRRYHDSLRPITNELIGQVLAETARLRE